MNNFFTTFICLFPCVQLNHALKHSVIQQIIIKHILHTRHCASVGNIEVSSPCGVYQVLQKSEVENQSSIYDIFFIVKR